MTDCDKLKEKESDVSAFIIPIVKFLNTNPEAKIPIYDQKDKQWYTLELNSQKQLVVAMRLPNGAPVRKLLDLQGKGFLFNPEILNQPDTQVLKPEEDEAVKRAENILLANPLGIILKGMQEDTRIKAILTEKQDLKPAIITKARVLAENLSSPQRKLTARKIDSSLELEYGIWATGVKDSINALYQLVEAAGSELEHTAAFYHATIRAENLARFLIIELLKALMDKLPNADPLKKFLDKTQSIREALFKVHIQSTANNDVDRRKIKIIIF